MTTNRKATHNGTCQACGRVQAVDPVSGTLAKHGYTVTFGFFMGTCAGSARKPVEHATDLLDRTVASCIAEAQKMEAIATGATPIETVSVCIARTRDPRTYKVSREFQDMTRDDLAAFMNDEATLDHRRSIGIYGSDVDDVFRRMVENARRSAGRLAAEYRNHAEVLTGIKADRHGKDLYPRTKVATCSKRGCNNAATHVRKQATRGYRTGAGFRAQRSCDDCRPTFPTYRGATEWKTIS